MGGGCGWEEGVVGRWGRLGGGCGWEFWFCISVFKYRPQNQLMDMYSSAVHPVPLFYYYNYL